MTNHTIDRQFNDLEIRILLHRDEGYRVEIALGSGQEFEGHLSPDILPWTSSGDSVEDGWELFKTLFEDQTLRTAWAEIRGQSPQRRIRLRIDPSAGKLHALPWELLQEDVGQNRVMLSAHADTPFSRYMPIALPWRGVVEERPIRVLVAISNPGDLETDKYNLPRLDVDLEREILTTALGGLNPNELKVDFLDPPVTLVDLEKALRTPAQGVGGYHVLHYLGHGEFNDRRNQAILYFQDDTGNTHIVTDDALIKMLVRQKVRPRLVFLAACESARRSPENAFLGLGPKLVSAGVPAVVAMQEVVGIETARQLSAEFYQRLIEHGAVDCALNEARSTLMTAGRPDAAVPVLFMRLKSGQLWGAEANARGQVLGSKPHTFWEGLILNIEDRMCVPIIGPRAHGRWLPTPAAIARKWSERHQYPFPNKDELASVAQYLVSHHGESFPRRRLLKTLRAELVERLPEELRPKSRPRSLTALIQGVGWQNLVADDPNQVHKVLASLDIPLYLTTNCDNFMVEALLAQGKEPKREICRWNKDLTELDSQFDNSDYEPTVTAPLVYHLFGSDEQPESLVLAQDDYLDFLVNTSDKKDRIPHYIRGGLASNSLLFVGYSLHDWEFQVIMRGLVATVDQRFKLNHVAVQLEETGAENIVAVQAFLRKYFEAAHIDVFWGSTAQFMAELREHWEEEHR